MNQAAGQASRIRSAPTGVSADVGAHRIRDESGYRATSRIRSAPTGVSADVGAHRMRDESGYRATSRIRSAPTGVSADVGAHRMRDESGCRARSRTRSAPTAALVIAGADLVRYHLLAADTTGNPICSSKVARCVRNVVLSGSSAISRDILSKVSYQ